MFYGLTALDIVVLALAALMAWSGFSAGFVAEAIRLGGWVVAIAMTRLFHTTFEAITTRWTGNTSGGAALSVALLFFGTILVARVLASALGGATRKSLIGPFDRFLGLGLGLVKGLIAASVLFLLATFTSDVIEGGTHQRPAWLADARTAPLLSVTSRTIVDWVEHRRHTDDGAAPAPQTGSTIPR